MISNKVCNKFLFNFTPFSRILIQFGCLETASSTNKNEIYASVRCVLSFKIVTHLEYRAKSLSGEILSSFSTSPLIKNLYILVQVTKSYDSKTSASG